MCVHIRQQKKQKRFHFYCNIACMHSIKHTHTQVQVKKENKKEREAVTSCSTRKRRRKKDSYIGVEREFKLFSASSGRKMFVVVVAGVLLDAVVSGGITRRWYIKWEREKKKEKKTTSHTMAGCKREKERTMGEDRYGMQVPLSSKWPRAKHIPTYLPTNSSSSKLSSLTFSTLSISNVYSAKMKNERKKQAPLTMMLRLLYGQVYALLYRTYCRMKEKCQEERILFFFVLLLVNSVKTFRLYNRFLQ